MVETYSKRELSVSNAICCNSLLKYKRVPLAGDVRTAALAKYSRMALSGDARLVRMYALDYGALTRTVDATVAAGS